MNRSAIMLTPALIGVSAVSGGSNTGTSLNTDWIVNTAGKAGIGLRWMARTTDPIDEFYVFLHGVGGTLGSVTMECKVYNEGASSSRCGTTVRATSTTTTMPGGTSQWVKFAFGTPYTPAVGEILWIVCYNTSASPTVDYPIIRTASNISVVNSTGGSGPAYGYTTTAGFSSSGTLANELPWVLKCGSSHWGQPFTQLNSTYYTSNTRERGIQFTPTVATKVSAFNAAPGTTSWADFKLYANATAPGGSTILTVDLDSPANATTGDACGGAAFAVQTLAAGTTYKAVISFGTSAQSPYVLQIEDYSTYSTLFDALRAFDTVTCPWGCIDDGAGGWTIDKAISPGLCLYIEDEVLAASSGVAAVIGG